MAGVPQVKAFNPYQEIPATTAAALAGVTVQPGRDGLVLYTQVPQSWSMLEGVDFGTEGAKQLTVTYGASCDGTLSVVLDDLQAAPAAVLNLTKAYRGETVTLDLPEVITGVHSVYFVYSAPSYRFSTFRFS